ncbi:MAG: glycosyltransferase [Candidatus Omnitrophica bacterium]|nr:glycosyltransferase [Candidatus Omnitrophota bacterium]MBU4487674.1 glycosyltransferase [Candidatus Omnitrophota bacterium]MCG2705214.1 glycosyltransferase [Candidatus Omnitrophota bacterium]
MAKKILIAYANAGAGHRKAAYAVESAFKEINRNDIETKVIDALDYSTPFFKTGYPTFYLFAVNKIPYIWGIFYYLLDTRLFYRCIASYGRRLHNSLGFAGLEKFLGEYNPDIVINTHFLGSEVMVHMKKKGMLKNTKLVSVVTDYMMHAFWVDKMIDYFSVAQEESKKDLMNRGIPAEKIRVFGIPIDRKFAAHTDRKELCAKLGIDGTKKTVLIGSGGFGVGPVKELVKELMGTEAVEQLLVVCGKNPELCKYISNMTKSAAKVIKVYEFVDNMDELMSVSDIIVTKSGGMTSSEAMAKDLPMIITSAIPGQEARNSKYLVKCGAAIQAPTIKKAREAIVEIFSYKDKLEELKNRIRAIKKPNSSYDIAQFAINLLDNK